MRFFCCNIWSIKSIYYRTNSFLIYDSMKICLTDRGIYNKAHRPKKSYMLLASFSIITLCVCVCVCTLIFVIVFGRSTNCVLCVHCVQLGFPTLIMHFQPIINQHIYIHINISIYTQYRYMYASYHRMFLSIYIYR